MPTLKSLKTPTTVVSRWVSAIEISTYFPRPWGFYWGEWLNACVGKRGRQGEVGRLGQWADGSIQPLGYSSAIFRTSELYDRLRYSALGFVQRLLLDSIKFNFIFRDRYFYATLLTITVFIHYDMARDIKEKLLSLKIRKYSLPKSI